MTTFNRQHFMSYHVIKMISLVLAIMIGSNHTTFAQYADSAMKNDEHAQWVNQLSGTWDVTMTAHLLPEEKPMTVKGIVAHRSLLNNFTFYEEMFPAAGSKVQDFKRISYLSYNLNEQHWDYMVIDSRITAGIMFFTNYSSASDSIVSYILNFPHPGVGPTQKSRGKTVFARNVIIKKSEKENLLMQYWRFTDGKEWLGMMYEYKKQ